MRVRWILTKARHAAISFEVVEWSEQLRSVTSVWLGAAAAAFKSDSAPAGVRVRRCLIVVGILQGIAQRLKRCGGVQR